MSLYCYASSVLSWGAANNCLFQQEKKPAKPQDKQQQESGDGKKVSRLGLEAKKEENLSDWFSQVCMSGIQLCVILYFIYMYIVYTAYRYYYNNHARN